MNVFEYLKNDEEHILSSLEQLTEHYPDWSMDRVFEGIKQAIDSLQKHIHKKESMVLANVHAREKIEDLIAKFEDKKTAIDEIVENLVMIHVDEPGFEQQMTRLTKYFKEFSRFSQEELYPAILKVATKDELRRMNEQLETMVLS